MKMNNTSKDNAAKFMARKLSSSSLIILGSGSTVDKVIEYIAELHPNKEKLRIVSASNKTSNQLKLHSIAEITLDELENTFLDEKIICVDGADQIIFSSPKDSLVILKGHGAALVREKVLWEKSDVIYVVIDESKITTTLTKYIPVEIIPIAHNLVQIEIESLYPTVNIRLRKEQTGEALITDNCNYILEIHHDGEIKDFHQFHDNIKQLTGVVDTGIFGEKLLSKCKYVIGYSDRVELID